MARKKNRCRHKKRYSEHYFDPKPSPFKEALLHDQPLIINFFKRNPNTLITSKDLMKYLNLTLRSSSSVSVGIKLINRDTDFKIETIRGHGYVHYTEEEDNGNQ